MINNYMDPVLVSIYKIKDIEEITFSDLAPSSNEGKIQVIPSLFVRYNGGKYLNLCSKDKYFDIYVKKVFEVYNKEKDRVISDPVFDPFGTKTKLKIDDKTKMILESGDLSKINEVYSFYDGKKGFDSSLIFQSDEFRLYIPLIMYHLKSFFEVFGKTIVFENEYYNGYKNNYSIDYKIDGLDDILLINFKSNDNKLVFNIRSRERMFSPIEMKVFFNDRSIVIALNSKEEEINCENVFVLGDNSIDNIFREDKKLIPVVYKKNTLKRVDNPYLNISGIDSSDDINWFLLPWYAYYGVNDRVDSISETEEVRMSNNKYLAFNNLEFMVREYASKEYRRNKTFSVSESRVVMDEVNKRIYGLLLDKKEGIYLIETHFEDSKGGNGYYNTYLNDKYFYHLCVSDDMLLGLNKNNLVNISSENNIIKPADVLVKEDIRKILKR